MRIALCLAAALCLGTSALAQTMPPGSAATSAQSEDAPKPPSKAEIKKAHKLFEQADKLQKDGKFQQAFELLKQAVELDPTRAEYLSMQEMVRQQLVTNHINAGNDLLAAKKQAEALAEFQQALALDPKNDYALQRVQDALPRRTPTGDPEKSHTLTMVAESQPAVLAPSPKLHSFHYRGLSRSLLDQIASTYGVKAIFDDSVTNKPVRFDIEDVDFFTAIREADKLAKTFWFPLSAKQAIFVNDTAAQHREMDRMVTRTFYVSDATAPTDVNDVVNLMRTIFDIRFVAAQPTQDSVIVRAPAAVLDAASKVLENFFSRKPQVNLEIDVYHVNHTFARDIGIALPTNFQAINVGAAALALLGQGNNTDIQSLINQLFSSGGINQANSQGIQALLAQLQGQQNSTLQQLANTPFTTFGGGKTLFAVPLPGTSFHLSMNQSDLQSLSKLTLRTAQGNTATMRLGSRYPILNASFAPLYNNSAIANVLANGSYAAPFPSFTYEDLGITVKATPQVLSDSSVNLKIEMEIKDLTGQSINGVPVISNRQFTATMSLKDGDPAAVAGMITQSEQKSLTGIPGLGHIPVVRELTSEQTKDVNADELLVVITPHIISPTRSVGSGTEVWLPAM